MRKAPMFPIFVLTISLLLPGAPVFASCDIDRAERLALVGGTEAIRELSDIKARCPADRQARLSFLLALSHETMAVDRWGRIIDRYQLKIAAYWLEQARELDPQDAIYPIYLGILRTDLQEYKEARELLEPIYGEVPSPVAEAYDPLVSDGVVAYAQALWHTGNRQDAVRILKLSIAHLGEEALLFSEYLYHATMLDPAEGARIIAEYRDDHGFTEAVEEAYCSGLHQTGLNEKAHACFDALANDPRSGTLYRDYARKMRDAIAE